MKRIMIVGLGILALSACRTAGTSGLKDAEGGASAPQSFCVGPKSLADLKEQSFGFDKWAQTFKEGRASEDLIPSHDRPGVASPGQGFPKILYSNLGNSVANQFWGGKTMLTKADGSTGLVNRFLQNAENSLDLFTAKVVVDPQSKWTEQDGKPVILLDYRQSLLTSSTPVGSLFVPVIKAIRDEIRLVCESTENGNRRRLYLGPTFLLPNEFSSLDLVGRALAHHYEHEPILWFALEFNDQVAP